MTNPDTVKFCCSGEDNFVLYTHAFSEQLPGDFRYRFRAVVIDYVIAYGTQGAYDRLNGRTLSQIFAEYKTEERKTVATGEVDGVRYTLYDPHDSNSNDNDTPSEERKLPL